MSEKHLIQGVSLLTLEECRDIVELRLGNTNTEIIKVNANPFSETPAGFLGDHFRLIITVSKNKLGLFNEKPEESLDLSFFVKTLPNNHLHSDYVTKTGMNRKEQGFYSILVRDFCKYQMSNEIVNESINNDDITSRKLSWASASFLTSPKFLVLEDLSTDGYRVLPKNSTMDYDHCVIALQSLARFHASSIIFEEKEAERTGVPCHLNNMHPDILEECFWSQKPGHPGKGIFESGIKSLLALVKHLNSFQQGTEECNAAYKMISGLFEEACEFVKTSRKFKNVVTHGDLWANNILFRYDKNTMKPRAVKIVDFQLLRYAPPAQDVVCFIHLNTRRSFREKYQLDLALAYHVALKAELLRHRVNVEHVLPWSQFKASLTHYYGLGVITANLFFPMILMPSKAMTEIFESPERFKRFMFEDRSDEVCKCFENDAEYPERLTEALEELVEYLTVKN